MLFFFLSQVHDTWVHESKIQDSCSRVTFHMAAVIVYQALSMRIVKIMANVG